MLSARLTRDNPAFHEEIFGPVAVVVPFDTDAEAIELANDTEYGLSAAILSQNVGRALKLGEQLRVGLLHINDQTVNDEVVNPFGGVGASGVEAMALVVVVVGSVMKKVRRWVEREALHWRQL